MAASSGLGLARPPAIIVGRGNAAMARCVHRCTGTMERGRKAVCHGDGYRPTTAQRRTIGVRAQIEGPRSSGPDPKRAREPSGSPRRDRGQERECEAKAVDAEKAGNAGRARASAAGMLAVIVPGVAEAVHGKSGTCSKAL